MIQFLSSAYDRGIAVWNDWIGHIWYFTLPITFIILTYSIISAPGLYVCESGVAGLFCKIVLVKE